MPIMSNNLQQWSCTQCDWRYDAVVGSDVLLPPPEKCPKCGHDKIVLRAVSLLDKVKSLFN